MKYQREGLLLPEPTEPQIDAELHQTFQAAHLDATETYRQMSIEGARKQTAMADLREGKDVDLTAHSLDPSVLGDRIAALKSWKDDLLVDQTLDSDIKLAYRRRVNEDIANIHMLDASQRGDMEEFRRWNKFIYGEPDEAVYRAALDWVAHDAEGIAAKPDQHPNAVAAAERVLAMLDGQRGYRELLFPDPEVFEAVRADHMSTKGYFGLMLAGYDVPKQKITQDIGDPILLHILQNSLQSNYGLIDSPSKTWSMVHSQEAMERPAEYNMLYKRFMGLSVGHEPRHLLGLINGRRGPLALASDGMDRYERTDEGRAVIGEQVPYDTFDDFGKIVRWRDILRRDIVASYGWGVGGDGPRTSQQTYQFIKTIDTMYQAKLTPDDPKATEAKAHDKAGSLILRELRGVDGHVGGAYLKDIVYPEGHVASWLAAALRGPSAINEGDLGKYDISSNDHVALLQKLGLLPTLDIE